MKRTPTVNRMIADERKGIREYGAIIRDEKRHLRELRKLKRKNSRPR